jgi:hypothetical protein
VHQVKVDALLDQRIAGAEKVLNRVEASDDLRIKPGLFLHFTQRRLLRRLPFRHSTLRKSPSRSPARRDHGHERHAAAKVDDRTS